MLERIQGRTELHPLLGALLPTIISGLVTALETTKDPADAHSSKTSSARPNKLVSLINSLILQVHARPCGCTLRKYKFGYIDYCILQTTRLAEADINTEHRDHG